MTRFAAELSRSAPPAVAVGEVIGPILERIGPNPDLAVVLGAGPIFDSIQEVEGAINALLGPKQVVSAQVDAVFATSLASPAGFVGDGLVVLAGELGAAHLDVGRRDGSHAQNASSSVVWLPAAESSSTPLLRMPIEGTLRLDGNPADAVTIRFGSAGGRVVLSEGFRPLSEPMTVTQAGPERVHSLAFTPASQVLEDALARCSPQTRELARDGIFLSLHVNESAQGSPEGLQVREVAGATPAGSLATVSSSLNVARTRLEGPDLVGMTAQLVVRDPQAPPLREGVDRSLDVRASGVPREIESRAPFGSASLMVSANRDPRLDLAVVSDLGTNPNVGCVVGSLALPDLRKNSDLGGVSAVLVFD